MFGKKKAAVLVAELVGTTLLTLSVISIRSSGIGYSFFVALGAGLTVTVMTLAVGATSGAQFNPALTIGLWTSRKIKTIPAILYVAVQLLGGAIAYWLYIYLVKTHIQSTGGHFTVRIMLAEALGAFAFTFAWAAAAAQKYEGLRLAAAVGGALTVGILAASIASNGLINPAVALGTRSWVWGTYVLGPIVGGILGVNVYNYLFAPSLAGAKSAKKSTKSSKK